MNQESNKDVTVYWRPGCMFCAGLFHSMASAGIAHTRVNIWEDPDAAAFVRSIARGNETVPTVTIGEQAFVNPGVQQLTDALR